MSKIPRYYPWPASALTGDDMSILVALREATGKPITKLLSLCVLYADTKAIKKQFPPKKMKKVVKAEKGAAVINDKEVIEISGTWKPSELRNLLKNIPSDKNGGK